MAKSIWQHKKIHMTGVKGVGMAALAEVLLANGFKVRGSDIKEKFMTDEVLERLGVKVGEFSRDGVIAADAVIRSNAYDANHPEIAVADKAGIPVFSYPQVAAELFNASFGIAVAGSHGKTTTTAMLAHILKSAGKNVTAVVGSKVINWQSGALCGDLKKPGALFVLEADEYKEAFLNYRPKGAIITNIDYDHPDYFSNLKDYQSAFGRFAALVPKDGFLIAPGNDKSMKEAVKKAKCRIRFVGKSDILKFNLQTIGKHNQFNASLARLAALELGISDGVIKEALETFKGTARRLELVGMAQGALVFDDYAHHPTEIKATLSALSERYPDKEIIAVFQPHTYSRTKALFDDFASAFSRAHTVILTDVYASVREHYNGGINLAIMTSKINLKGSQAVLINDKSKIPEYLLESLSDRAVVVTMGAGNIREVAEKTVQTAICAHTC